MRRIAFLAVLTASLAAVVAVTAGTAASATSRAPGRAAEGQVSAAVSQRGTHPGCRSSTWSVDLGFAGVGYDMSPLILCGTGEFGVVSVHGTAHNLEGCSAVISGILSRPGSIEMSWAWTDGCTPEVTYFNGTLHLRQGTASGRWHDPFLGESGNWTAVRTS